MKRNQCINTIIFVSTHFPPWVTQLRLSVLCSLERDVGVLSLCAAAQYAVHGLLWPLVHEDPRSVALLGHCQVLGVRVYLQRTVKSQTGATEFLQVSKHLSVG